jgi:hypothetical protein
MADTAQPPPGGDQPPGGAQAAGGAHPPGGAQAAGGAHPPGDARAAVSPSRSNNPTNNALQRTRSLTCLWVVVLGDAAIVVAAVWGIVKTSGSATGGSPVVAILTSAFTAIGTMTTAYFGIRSATNTAQSWSPQGAAGQHGAVPQGENKP